MARCDKCGYELQPYDTECPKCARLAQAPSEATPVDGPPSQDPATPRPGVRPQPPSSTALLTSGAVAGAIYGAIVLLVFITLDRMAFGGSESRGLSFLAAAALAAVSGAVFGAIVGLVTAAAGSVGAGVGAGALLLGIFKAAGISLAGFGGGFALLALLAGLVYGALLGWVVASSVIKSVKGL